MDDYQNPKDGKTYISPRLKSFGNSDKKVRIASKLIESSDSYTFAKIKDEIVLRHKDDAKSYIKAKFIEDIRKIFVLSIQKYTVGTDNPHSASFSFVGEEISKLIEFIQNIQSINLEHPSSFDIKDEDFKKIVLSNSQAKSMLHENQALFAEVLRSEITTEDIVAVGYRKKQLEVFQRLLNDSCYFNELKSKKIQPMRDFGRSISKKILGSLDMDLDIYFFQD